MNMDVSKESPSSLSLEDMTPSKDSSTNLQSDTTISLVECQEVLTSTHTSLEKLSNKKNCQQESTSNESDFKESNNNTHSASTPIKHSEINKSDLLRQTDVSNTHIMNQISLKNEFIQKNKQFVMSKTKSSTSYINSFKTPFEASETVSQIDIIGNSSKQSLEFDSGMFQPAEDIKEQFDADEKAWRQKHAVLPNTTRTSINTEAYNSPQFDEDISIGEFFGRKSDSCSFFNKGSPLIQQIPFVNSTTIEDNSCGSNSDRNTSTISNTAILDINQRLDCVMSLSGIHNIITSESTANKVIETWMDEPFTLSKISNQSQSTHFINSQNFSIISQQLKLDIRRDQILTPTIRNDGDYNSRTSCCCNIL